MKPRRWNKDNFIMLAALAAAVVVLYALHPGCVWKALFGHECLGCGLSRGCVALARLRPARAWRYNPIAFSVPFWCGMLVTFGKPFESARANRVLLWSLLGATAALAVFRICMMIFFPR